MTRTDVNADTEAINEAFGAWRDREVDGAEYVETLRSGDRLEAAQARPPGRAGR